VDRDEDIDVTVSMDALDEVTCARLLERSRFGRVGFLLDGELIVLPVNCAVVGGEIVFRTSTTSPLFAVRDGRSVVVQVDHVDDVSESGWSVLVRGQASEVTDATRLDELGRLDLHPWAPGPRDHWIRIVPVTMTGRSVDRHRVAAPGQHLPYMPPD
jgi:uncharacterized protein